MCPRYISFVYMVPPVIFTLLFGHFVVRFFAVLVLLAKSVVSEFQPRSSILFFTLSDLPLPPFRAHIPNKHLLVSPKRAKKAVRDLTSKSSCGARRKPTHHDLSSQPNSQNGNYPRTPQANPSGIHLEGWQGPAPR